MKMAKRLLVLVFAFVLVAVLASCGGVDVMTNTTTADPNADAGDKAYESCIIRDGEVFAYNAKGERLTYDEEFLEYRENTYYVINNLIIYNRFVLDGAIYDFGSEGKMAKGEKDGYTYGEDGKLVGSELFVPVGGDVYYVINNVIVYNQIVAGDAIYDFGSDGKMFKGEKDGFTYGEDGKLVANEDFVTVNGDIYYLINNIITFNQFIIDGFVYDFGSDGKMVTGTKGEYTYGADGKLIGTDLFVTVAGNVYYVVNNVIVYNQYIIEGAIYDFGSDGKMVTGQKGEYTYGADGKLIADEIFLTIGGDVYYIINNIIVYNQFIVDGFVYDFGEDGKMFVGTKGDLTYGEDGKLIADEIFLTIGGDVYYIINNIIVYNQFIIDGAVYDFGADGKMTVGEKDGYTYGEDGKLIGSDIFVTVAGDVYFVVNNVIIFNQYIIDGAIYDFGTDGKMVTGTKGDYTYGADGKMIGSEIFVTINGDVYYIINNVIVYNQFIIDGAIYDFGTDGKMTTGEKDGKTYGTDGKLVADNVFVTIEGNVYYIINNTIIYNQIVVIDGAIYDFGADGKMTVGTKGDYTYGADGKLIANKVFVEIGGDTYYIVNNTIATNYVVIDGYVYNFGEDGKMAVGNQGNYEYAEDGKLLASDVLITAGGKVYYIVNNIIIYNTYKIVDGRLYYFSSEGYSYTNVTVDGYTFGANGYVTGNGTITLDGTDYIISNGYVYEKGLLANIVGKIYESDHDTDLSNNTVLSYVIIRLEIAGRYFDTTADASGNFKFENVPVGTAKITFALTGYIATEITIEAVDVVDLTIVMDKSVSNSLTGKIVVASSGSGVGTTALSGAKVTLRRTTSTNELYYETTTNSSGNYTFTGLTAGVYELTVSKEGYVDIVQNISVRANQNNIQNLTIEAISNTQTAPGYASGVITDAKTGNVVSGMTVYIYKGINVTSGTPVATVTTNANGNYTTPELVPGNYTAFVVDERVLDNEELRYSSLPIAIKVLSGTTVSNQNGTISNSVGLDIDGMRIILSWGSSPSDLDSHLWYGNNHVYHSVRNLGNVSLDTDDTSSYGPETITVSSIEEYTYTYYVYNYSQRSSGNSATTMANAQARVEVYFGNSSTPAYTFYGPTTSGVTWNVFSYNAVTGEFTVNNITNNIDIYSRPY